MGILPDNFVKKDLCRGCYKFFVPSDMASKTRCGPCLEVSKNKKRVRASEYVRQRYNTDEDYRIKQLRYRKHYFEDLSPEKRRELRLPTRLNPYNITPEQFLVLLDKQEGKCAICSREGGYALHVDHCHKTGTVRGLLCNGCNTGLGKFGDSVKGLEKAIAYLKSSADY